MIVHNVSWQQYQLQDDDNNWGKKLKDWGGGGERENEHY